MKFTFCKKQYIYLALAIVSACIALTTHVFAQEPFEPGLQEGGPGGAAMNEEPRGNTRGEISEKVRDRVINLAGNLEAQMRATIERMTNIASRLDTRILKLKATGVSTEAAESELTRARASLQVAQDALNALVQALQKLPVADDAGASFNNARAQLMQAHTALQDTTAVLRNVVALLKDAMRTQPATPTDSSETIAPSGN